MKKNNKMITGKEKKVLHKFFFSDIKKTIEAEDMKSAQKKHDEIISKKK